MLNNITKIREFIKTFSFILLPLILLSLIFLLVSCTQPNPQNCFDPQVDPDDWAPTNLEFNILSTTSVELLWTDNCNNEDGFIIERKKNSNNWIQFEYLGVNVTQYVDETFNNTDIFLYRIYAFAGENNSAYSNEIAIIFTEGLVAYYPFNGNANDESGNGNNGITEGEIQLDVDRFGNENCSYIFDGTNDKITVPNDDQLNSDNGSWSVWIKPLIDGGYIITKDTYGYNNDGKLSINIDGYISFLIDANGVFNSAISNNPYQWNNWYHIVAIWGASGISIYIDTVLVGTLDFYEGISCIGDLVFGGIFSNYSNPWFNGNIDDIRIYNRALTESEIQALYHEDGWDE